VKPGTMTDASEKESSESPWEDFFGPPSGEKLNPAPITLKNGKTIWPCWVCPTRYIGLPEGVGTIPLELFPDDIALQIEITKVLRKYASHEHPMGIWEIGKQTSYHEIEEFDTALAELVNNGLVGKVFVEHGREHTQYFAKKIPK